VKVGALDLIEPELRDGHDMDRCHGFDHRSECFVRL
jgi:hypothetical protein